MDSVLYNHVIKNKLYRSEYCNRRIEELERKNKNMNPTFNLKNEEKESKLKSNNDEIRKNVFSDSQECSSVRNKQNLFTKYETPIITPKIKSCCNKNNIDSGIKQTNLRPKQFYRKSLGDWTFIKLIGNGSMGKVKLAQNNITRELCAVKIMPRAANLYLKAHANEPPPTSTDEAAQRQKDFEKELAKDHRTIREGALGKLLFHPYICRLYEIVSMSNHYYMLFEYIDGGQMLDYMVSHGTLKEKQARKFARGIASALDYCHKNNIVHRDLKIENIMINDKGDIKIIDFGLSNLYSSTNLLKTYCGSLYFAAPELLRAKPYTGPEVDIWSFGVVLYVLVCGKVPFDDPSVSALHEKIKKGEVEYPNFLSKDFVSLLSMMLQVDSNKRASLYEIINHPWMNKGYDHKIINYLSKRVPLSFPLDFEIIKTISSFNLGSVQNITEELTLILTSMEYQMSCQNWYKLAKQGVEYSSTYSSHFLPDPTYGFHPLISIYYLIDEMRKRKKIKNELIKIKSVNNSNEISDKQFNFESSKIISNFKKGKSSIPNFNSYQIPHTITKPEILCSPFEKVKNKKPLDTYDVHPINKQLVFNDDDIQKNNHKFKLFQDSNFNSPELKNPDTEKLNFINNKPAHNLNTLFRRLSKKSSKNFTALPDSFSSSLNQHNPCPKSQESKNNSKLLTQKLNSVLFSHKNNFKNKPSLSRGMSMKVTAKEKLYILKNDSDSINNSQNTINTKMFKHNVSVKPKKNKDVKNLVYMSSQVHPTNDLFCDDKLIISNKNKTINQLSLNSFNYKLSRPLKSLSRKFSINSKFTLSNEKRDPGISFHLDEEIENQNYTLSQNSQDLNCSLTNDNLSNHLNNATNFDHSETPENQIIDQFKNSKANEMLSIKYCKTLFLKGFFSVQTTSTKPLPIVRHNIITALTKFGVKYQEVKGGFICTFTSTKNQLNSVSKKKNNENNSLATNSTTISTKNNINFCDKSCNENKVLTKEINSFDDVCEKNKFSIKFKNNENKLNDDSKSFDKRQIHQSNSQFGNLNSNSFKKNSNSIDLGKIKRIQSVNMNGGSIRRKQVSQSIDPNNISSNVKSYKPVSNNEDNLENSSKELTEDSIDSFNGIVIEENDLVEASKIECNNLNYSDYSGNQNLFLKSVFLKFEIHIVKIFLVSIYGIQFKKLLGDAWCYKTLASQILKQLCL